MKDKDYNITEDQDYISAVSSTDCTGLIPALPQDEAQLESYQDLYPFNPEDGSAKPKSVR